MNLGLKFIFFVLFLSTAAHSHPEDGDYLEKIGTRTKLTFKKDLNIKPNTIHTFLQNGKILNSDNGETLNANQPFCYFHVSSVVDYDRVIKANTEWKVYTTRGYRGPHYYSEDPISYCTYLEAVWLNNQTKDFIICAGPAEPFDGSDGALLPRKRATIGDLRKSFGDFLEITYPDPEPL